MRLKSLIYMLDKMDEIEYRSIRYIECVSKDTIRVVLDNNIVVRVTYANGTDVVLSYGGFDDDKRQTGYSSDADE